MNATLVHLSRLDHAACTAFNRVNHRRAWSMVFGAISRLGDGVFWYAMMVILPFVHGPADIILSLALALNGAACTLLYRWLKGATQRPRPCEVYAHLRRTVAPLDRFSFPSGHTLHAVAFTVLIGCAHPAWCAVLVPFTVLVAGSRLVLGLHYPSDVIAGAAIGGAVSLATWLLGGALGIL